jgi:hypothetical protein
MTQITVDDPAAFRKEYYRLRGEKQDRFALRHAKQISMFWILETQARTKRVERWVREKKVNLVPEGFPMYRVLDCTV